MPKVVINRSFGGFSLSVKALERLYERGVITEGIPEKTEGSEHLLYDDCLRRDGLVYFGHEVRRDHPELVKVVEELGEDSWGKFAELKIVEVPDDVEWEIEEYDGVERVVEKHRVWE